MTTDEIVRALHKYAKNAQENFEVDTMRDFDSAADLIESLQAQLAESQRREQAAENTLKETWEWDMYQCANREIERLRKTLQLVQLDRDTAYEEMNRLKSELSASQARERAAVEDIHEIDRFNGKCFRCKSWNGVRCKRGYSVNVSFCNDWQWRGPQEARKGG